MSVCQRVYVEIYGEIMISHDAAVRKVAKGVATVAAVRLANEVCYRERTIGSKDRIVTKLDCFVVDERSESCDFACCLSTTIQGQARESIPASLSRSRWSSKSRTSA